jgi:ATP-dependent helicase/DNAse subunit B
VSFSLYLGPYQPFLEEKLAQAYAAHREKDPLGPLLILVPNVLLVGHLKRVLAEKNESVFNTQVHTLHHYLGDFTQEKILAEGSQVLPEVLTPWVLKEAASRTLKTGSVFQAVRDTPGFYRALRKTLAEIREGLFNPESLKGLAASGKKTGDRKLKRFSLKAVELAALLESYQGLKAKGPFVDREDLYFKALEVAPAGAGAVFIYGFYDATPLQKKVLLHLAHSPSSRWFVPYEDHPAFEYAKSFVDWAKDLGRVMEEGQLKPEADSPLSRLKTQLFRETPAPSGNAAADGSFEASDFKIFLCPGESREGKEIARGILARAQDGSVALSDGAILLRDTESYRKILPQAFEDEKVPLARPLPGPLLETLEGKTLLSLLDCYLRGFPRDETLNFLSMPNLVPDAFEVREQDWNPSAWDGMSREAKVVEGRAEWRRRLSAWKKDKQREARREKEDFLRQLESAESFQKVLESLFKAGDAFRKMKDWSGKAVVLRDTARKLMKATPRRDEILTLLDTFALFSRFFSKALPAEEFRAVLAALLQETKNPQKQADPGGVPLHDLMQARGVSFELVALPGLVEKSIPRLVRQDPLLLDAEREEINRQARTLQSVVLSKVKQEIFNFDARLPEPVHRLALKKEGALEERLLFLLAVRSARKALILTAPSLNPLTGSPRTPSLYLFEAAEAVTGKRLFRLEEADGFVRTLPVQDWVKPDPSHCADELERLLTAFQQARLGNPASALALVKERPFYFEGANLLKARQAFPVFTAYDGKITGAVARKILKENNSPRLKAVSASRLETFAACPLRYFYKYVLRVAVTPEPDRVLQLEGADRGQLMHGILEETLERGLEEKWFEKKKVPQAQAFAALGEITDKHFQRFTKEGVTGAPALWAWEQGQIREDLKEVLEKVLEDPEWKPLELEAGFGPSAQEDSLASVLFPLEGGDLKLQGFIDRVDEARDGSAYRVVDYKTGSDAGFSAQKLKAGTKLQLPFYLWALQQIRPQKPAQIALYDFITRKGKYRQIVYKSESPEGLRDSLLQVIQPVVESVETGLFPAAGKDCARCDYRPLCGPGAVERGERKAQDPAMRSYYQLEEIE